MKKTDIRTPTRQALGRRMTPRDMCCLTAACATLVACTSAPTVLRPLPATTPPAEECPRGAQESMDTLKLRGVCIFRFPEQEFGEPHPVRVQEGPLTAILLGACGGLPDKTLLKGHVLFGPNRVHARFTEAQIPAGGKHAICLEAHDNKTGFPFEEGSTGDNIQVWGVGPALRVLRFH